MEKLQKNLFKDPSLNSSKRALAGACATRLGGSVTRCCGGGGCYLDMGQ